MRRGTPPPLLFQVDTLDPWQDSHPGKSLHSGARHEIDAAFERALGPVLDPAAIAEAHVADTHLADLFEPPTVPELAVVEPEVVEEPAAEQPAAEQPAAEQPAAEVPAVDEPAEPAVAEPTPAAAEPAAGAAVVEAPVPAVDPTVVELPHTTPDTSPNETTIVLPPIEGIVPAPPAPAIYTPPAAALAPPVAEPVVESVPVPEPETGAADPFVLEPPTYVPPVAAEPLVLEPPAGHQPGHESVSIEAPAEPEASAEPDGPVEPEAPPLYEVPTFWSPPPGSVALPPAPPVEQHYLNGPPLSPVEPAPRFFTKDGVPSAPVSLAKDVDPWTAALQPEAPPFAAEALTEVTEASPPVAEPRENWFDGKLDPFNFATHFGEPAEQFREPTLEDDPSLVGRHRSAGEAEQAPPRRRRRAAKEAKPARKAPWWELPALVALAIVIAVVVKTFVVQPFYIPSPSMEKTLHGCTGCSGDRILVNKPIYDFRDPHPGDIVVFNAPPGWNEEQGTKPPSNPILRAGRGFLQLIGFVPPDGLVLVKRVIAVGGQTVKGVSTDGGLHEQIMISNHGTGGPWKTLKEPYVFMDAPDVNANFGPVTVPKGRLWVMGDHRNDSADSRYHCGTPTGTAGTGACNPKTSTVPIDDVIGKAFVIAWPPSRWRTLGTPSTFAGGVVLPLFLFRRRRRRRPARA